VVQTNHRLFRDGVEGRAPMPPAAQTLGLEIVAVDPDAGTIEVTSPTTHRGATSPSSTATPATPTVWYGWVASTEAAGVLAGLDDGTTVTVHAAD
jgi:hypothetical protein